MNGVFPPRDLIFLIGYRGAGKSTVAALLSRRLAWDWLDADALLEQQAAMTIRQIFAEEGEAAFRDREQELLEDLCRRRQHVIATGGGVVLRDVNRERLKRAGFCVWLSADAHTIWLRLQADATTAERRPPLTVGGRDEVEQLLRIRTPLYRVCADLTVDTVGRSPADITDEIVRSLGWA